MFKQMFFLLFCCSTSIAVMSQQIELKPPVKDEKRLRLLPSQPPTRAEIVSSLQQSVQEIQKGMAPGKVAEVTKFTATQPIETIHQKAIMDFYSDDPKGAVLMMMQTAAKAPDSLLLLNNLSAMLNLHAAEHKAIPLLQYCLQKMPNNSIVLNNIGQSFLGLGDVLKAAAYFNQCLSIDSLNIEANHSMGMLHYFKKEYDAATKYFERELSIAVRSSTLAMAYRMGKKFNLRAITQRRQRRNGRAQKDHFEEITLGKFSFPNMPQSTTEIVQNQQFYRTYTASIQTEALTWTNYATQTLSSYTSAMGQQRPGLYSDLAKAMLDELTEEFTPEYLTNFTSEDYQNIMKIVSENTALLIQLKCPEPPAGTGIDAQEAYEIKCCRELKQPIADKMVREISNYVAPIIKTGEARWKSYINQLVEIVQLDPGLSNQSMVYHAVVGYFNYLSLGAAWFSSEVTNYIPKCFAPIETQDLDSLIESDREWKVNCPAWLNVEVDFDGVVLKVDCNKYVIEAGEGMMGAFEHEFKSGNSTLLFGPGAKGEFLGLKAEVKSQLFLTFDKNKNFSDFGIKNTAEIGLSGTPFHIGPNIKLGGNLAGVEISNTMSINGGYNESWENKGAMTLFK